LLFALAAGATQSGGAIRQRGGVFGKGFVAATNAARVDQDTDNCLWTRAQRGFAGCKAVAEGIEQFSGWTVNFWGGGMQ